MSSSKNDPPSRTGRRRTPKPAGPPPARRDEALAMPEVHPEFARRYYESTYGVYQPQNDEARRLVDAYVEAELMLSRANFYVLDTREKRSLDRHAALEAVQKVEVPALVGELRSDPGKAVRGLRQSSAGCRELIAMWGALARELVEGRPWDGDDREACARLRGLTFDQSLDDPDAPFWLYGETDVLSLLDGRSGARRSGKDALSGAPATPARSRRPSTPSDKEARRWLLRRITGIVAELKEREEYFRRDKEASQRGRLGTTESCFTECEDEWLGRYYEQWGMRAKRAWKELNEACYLDSVRVKERRPPAGPVFGMNRP